MSENADYYDEIKSWDWDSIIDETRQNIESDDEGNLYGCSYLGTIPCLFPSGKYYMPWCSNFTENDAEMDAAFQETLESVAGEYNGWIESGEGDPLDLFFMRSIENVSEKES